SGLTYFWSKLKAYFVAQEDGMGLSSNDFTDAEKEKLASIEQGEKGDTGETGADGKDGADGVSPIVTVEDTEDGVLITITDATGTTTANLTAGADGKDGYSPTVEVFKQVATWVIESTTAYFNGDTSATSFDVTDLDTVELVCWWISSGDSIDLTVTLTDSDGGTTTQTASLVTGGAVTLDTSNAVSVAISTSGSQTATGQLIYNDDTAEAGYYLKITWYNDETGETETIITDNLKSSNGSDGQDGQDGEDGYSPSASVEQTDTGATITITDKDGMTTATITNSSSSGGSDLTGGETDYGVIDISDDVVTLSSAVGMSTGVTGAEIFNDYTNNSATGLYSTAMGQYSTASGQNSLAVCAAQVQGDYSIAMGISCVAGNMYSVAISNTAKTSANHGISIGYYTTASGQRTVALGSSSTASGENAFVAGTSSTASGTGSVAIGYNVEASGQCGMAINGDTVASGAWALAAGRGTIAASYYQAAFGKWNVEDAENTYALIIGNGSDDENRSNLLTVDWSGNVNISGDLVVNNETSVTEIMESVTDSGWQDMTVSTGSTTLSDITLQYRTIGKQLYIKGNFTTNAAISADSHVYLAASDTIGEGDAFATGSGGEKSTTGAGITCYMYTNGINYFEFQLPTALDSGTTIYFGMSGTID
ncbi:MAG: hypothetical protein LUF89_04990, partial [Ruminococcus sp.]|nr:hypothetical protein [Ruminococcus sp.]